MTDNRRTDPFPGEDSPKQDDGISAVIVKRPVVGFEATVGIDVDGNRHAAILAREFLR